MVDKLKDKKYRRYRFFSDRLTSSERIPSTVQNAYLPQFRTHTFHSSERIPSTAKIVPYLKLSSARSLANKLQERRAKRGNQFNSNFGLKSGQPRYRRVQRRGELIICMVCHSELPDTNSLSSVYLHCVMLSLI